MSLDQLAKIDEHLSIPHEIPQALMKQINKVEYIDSKRLLKDLKRPVVILEWFSYLIRFYFKNKIRLTMAILDKKEVIADILYLKVEEVTSEDGYFFHE